MRQRRGVYTIIYTVQQPRAVADSPAVYVQRRQLLYKKRVHEKMHAIQFTVQRLHRTNKNTEHSAAYAYSQLKRPARMDWPSYSSYTAANTLLVVAENVAIGLSTLSALLSASFGIAAVCQPAELHLQMLVYRLHDRGDH